MTNDPRVRLKEAAALGKALKMLREVTDALEAADAAYHNCFEGDGPALKAYGRPEWARLVKRSRLVLEQLG